MPIYEYECKKCGRVEAIQGFNDEPLTKCPECNKAGVTKLLSAPAFHLKGNGWYATDFKNPTSCKKDGVSEAGTGGCGAGGCNTSDDKASAT
jgi:putative FmdB family regulatory protein